MELQRILLNKGKRKDEVFIDPDGDEEIVIDGRTQNIHKIVLKDGELRVFIRPKIRSKRG